MVGSSSIACSSLPRLFSVYASISSLWMLPCWLIIAEIAAGSASTCTGWMPSLSTRHGPSTHSPSSSPGICPLLSTFSDGMNLSSSYTTASMIGMPYSCERFSPPAGITKFSRYSCSLSLSRSENAMPVGLEQKSYTNRGVLPVCHGFSLTGSKKYWILVDARNSSDHATYSPMWLVPG